MQLRMLPATPLVLDDYVFSHTVIPSLYLSGDFTDNKGAREMAACNQRGVAGGIEPLHCGFGILIHPNPGLAVSPAEKTLRRPQLDFTAPKIDASSLEKSLLNGIMQTCLYIGAFSAPFLLDGIGFLEK